MAETIVNDVLVIDGVTMPPLKKEGLVITKNKIWSKNTGRVANGDMVGDLIAVKYTLDCEWPPLSAEQAKIVDNAIEPAFFNASFLDPATNTVVTKRFYAGSPTYPVYSYVSGIKTYAGVKVTIIQK
ncbi:MAG: hypothetical protein IJZ34_11000 [Lachnospiraceae bacterium]|nr:hypothetical protein [Lachnospiraceae bacterium]